MTQHRKAVEKRKNYIIRRLINSGYTKFEDGQQLYELPLTKLERLYIDMCIDRSKNTHFHQAKE